jgi:parallel beta-helix repeat protein
MPNIYGVDWATGADSGQSPATSIGGSPFKTTQGAAASSTPPVAGDEIRIGKSTSPTLCPANLNWNNNSTTVTCVGDYHTIYVAKVFIAKQIDGTRPPATGEAETLWEVASSSYAGGTTTITLVAAYSGASSTNTVSYYYTGSAGLTDTGTAASSSTQVQSFNKSGSEGSLIKISGGWNVSGFTSRDGNTWFLQSGTNKYGYGLYGNASTYINPANLGFLRYYYGIYLSSSSGSTVTSCTANSNNNIGIYLSSSSGSTVTSCTANSNNNNGIYLSSSSGSTVTSCTANSNSNNGILLSSSGGSTVTSCTANSNGIGIYLLNSGGLTVTSCTANSNSNGVRLWGSLLCIVNNFTFSGNLTADVSIVQASTYSSYVVAGCQQYGGVLGTNKALYEYGVAQRNTVNARSGDCVEFVPSSADYPISSYGPNDEWFVLCPASKDDTPLNVWLALSSGTNNFVVTLSGYVNGALVVGPTTVSPTTSYASYSITIPAASIPETQPILALRVSVTGTSGSVYVDDFMGF